MRNNFLIFFPISFCPIFRRFSPKTADSNVGCGEGRGLGEGGGGGKEGAVNSQIPGLYAYLVFTSRLSPLLSYGGPEGSHMQIKNVAAN